MLDPGTTALLDSWQLSLHDKRPRTVDFYRLEAERFARWAAEQGTPDLLEVKRTTIEAWLTSLRSAGLAQATLRSRWIVLRNLYGWLLDEEEIAVNPLAKVKVEKASTPPTQTLTEGEIKKLLKVCQGTGFYERRDTAIIRMLLATGVRVSELTGILTTDLDLTNRVVVIHGKGGKSRLVRFDPATAAALDRYLRARGRHRYASLPNLWVGFRGPMTRKGIPAVLNKRTVEAGIGHVHPHKFRHTWADRWLRAGGNEGDLQRLGGWESSEIMRRYGEARAVDRALAAYDSIDVMGGI